MQIRILDSNAGAPWSARPGDVVEVDEATGSRLILAGHAEPVREVLELEYATLLSSHRQ